MCHVTITHMETVPWETPVIPDYEALFWIRGLSPFVTNSVWNQLLAYSLLFNLFFFNFTNIFFHVFLLASLTPVSPLKLLRAIQIVCSEYLLMMQRWGTEVFLVKGFSILEGFLVFSFGSVLGSPYRLQHHCLLWHQFNVQLKLPKCCFVYKQ